MIVRAATILALGLPLIGCVSPSQNSASAAFPLDRLVDFVDPHRCEPGADFDALVNSLLYWKETGETYIPILRVPPASTKFDRQIGTPQLRIEGSEYRATLPLRGTWQGLPLRSLVLEGWVESEQGFMLVFDATPAQVLQAANRVGFGIPASGSEYREEEVMGVNVGVSEYEGGGALYCMPG